MSDIEFYFQNFVLHWGIQRVVYGLSYYSDFSDSASLSVVQLAHLGLCS